MGTRNFWLVWVIFLVEAHDHNAVYTHKEVCAQKHVAIDIRFKNQQYQINDNRSEIDGIHKKIDTTLIFAICTLIGIIMLFIKG